MTEKIINHSTISGETTSCEKTASAAGPTEAIVDLHPRNEKIAHPLESVAARVYHSLPATPPSRRSGIWDLYLIDVDESAVPRLLDIPPGALAGCPPIDGIVVISLDIALSPEDGSLAEMERAQLAEAVKRATTPMNLRWCASGRAGDGPGQSLASRTYTNCLVHFIVNTAFEIPYEQTSPLACRVLLSAEAMPGSCWEIDVERPGLGSGSTFELDVPPEARPRITIQNLKARIDQFHALPPISLTNRLALLREIKKGARAFTEVETEVGETWESDLAGHDGEIPAIREHIQEALTRYLNVGRDELSERIDRLEFLQSELNRFRVGDGLTRGWRATRYTLEIDSALSTFNDLPQELFLERMSALEKVEAECREFMAQARARRRLFNRALHGLLPAVEQLIRRIRDTRGELALLRGIHALRLQIEAKQVELGMLRATSALARRCAAAESGLVAEENSLTLRVSTGLATDVVSEVTQLLQRRFPSMLGMEKEPEDVSCADLRRLIRHVLPMEVEVRSISRTA